MKSKVKKIITEIKNEKNKELMDFCFEKEDENRNIYYIPSRKWLSRITAQTSRQSGFSVIAAEILNYENDEIYFAKVDEITPSIIGKTFKDVLLNCTTSIVLGIRKNNWNEEKLKENLREDYKQELKSKNKDKLLGLKKNIILNPFEKLKNNILDNENIGCLIEKGDELILLQFDDGKPEFNFEKMKLENVQWSKEKAKSLSKCSILILGYNERVPKVINELYEYIDKNSEIHIIANIKNEVQEKLEEEFKERNITIEIKDTTDYKVFENRKEFLNSFDSIIIMGYDDIDIQEKDAKSMLTMLLLKKMLENGKKENTKEKNIVIEIYDEKNREIVELTGATDYIISDNIISSVISQLSEEKRLYYVFDEILGSEGCEIYLYPLETYIENFDREYTFKELSAITLIDSAILLGYRKMEERTKKDKNYGVYLNLNKNQKIKLSKNDKLIVLCEGEV